MNEMKEHWIAVGRISRAARKQLLEAGCLVVDVSSQPPIALVCLRYQSSGEQFHEYLALTDVGKIEVKLNDLSLHWLFPGDWQIAHSSVSETELVASYEESEQHNKMGK